VLSEEDEEDNTTTQDLKGVVERDMVLVIKQSFMIWLSQREPSVVLR